MNFSTTEVAALEQPAGPFDAQIAAERAANLARAQARVKAFQASRLAQTQQLPEVLAGFAAVADDGAVSYAPQYVGAEFINHPGALRALAERRLGLMSDERRAELIATAQRTLAWVKTVRVFDEQASDGLPGPGEEYESAITLSRSGAEQMLAVCLGGVK